MRVLEARNRVGGRVFTAHDESGVYELGAEFIHGADKALEELVFGLTVCAVPTAQYAHRGGQLVRDDRFWDVIERFVEHVRGREGAVGDHLASFDEPELARIYVEGFHAADPAQFSVAAFLIEEDFGEDKTRRLAHGYEEFIARLAADVPVTLATSVREVRWREGHVCLTSDRGATFEARAAIVTVPAPILATLRFDPEIPRALAAAASLGMGDVARVVVRVARRAWPEGASFLHDPKLPFPVWWTLPDAEVPSLVGWAGGPAAARVRDREKDAIASLEALLDAKVEVRALHTHDWGRDPFAGGAYSYVRVGAEDASSVLAEPLARTIFFAGEALPHDAPRATVQGALSSGRHAAELLLASR